MDTKSLKSDAAKILKIMIFAALTVIILWKVKFLRKLAFGASAANLG